MLPVCTIIKQHTVRVWEACYLSTVRYPALDMQIKALSSNQNIGRPSRGRQNQDRSTNPNGEQTQGSPQRTRIVSSPRTIRPTSQRRFVSYYTLGNMLTYTVFRFIANGRLTIGERGRGHTDRLTIYACLRTESVVILCPVFNHLENSRTAIPI